MNTKYPQNSNSSNTKSLNDAEQLALDELYEELKLSDDGVRLPNPEDFEIELKDLDCTVPSGL